MRMAFETDAITGKIELDNSPAKDAFAETVKSAHAFKGDVENAMSGAGKSGGEKMLASIKEQLGKRSELGETFELLMGGGVVGGASLVGESIGGAFEKINSLNAEMREGKISGQEYFNQFASAIPVFGSFYNAGLQINEMFTHQKADLQEAQQALQIYSDGLEVQKDIQAQVRDVLAQGEAQLRKYNTEMALMGKQGLSADLLKDYLDAVNGAADGWEAVRGKIESAQRQVDSLRAQIKKLKAEDEESKKASVTGNVVKSVLRRDSVVGSLMKMTGIGMDSGPSVDINRAKINTLQGQIDSQTDLIKALRKNSQAASGQSMTMGLFKAMSDASANFKTKWKDAWDSFGQVAHQRAVDAKNQLDALSDAHKMHGLDKYQQATEKANAAPADLKPFLLNEIALQKGDDFADQVKDLQKQLDQVNMNPLQKQLDELHRNNKWMDQGQLDQLGKIVEKMHAQEMLQSIETPLEKFQKAKAEWDKELLAGNINPQQYARGILKAQDDSFGHPRNPGLYRTGSAESFARTFDEKRGNQREDAQVQIARDMLREQQKTNKNLEQVISGFQGENNVIDLPGLA
jgi:hypothetical protein